MPKQTFFNLPDEKRTLITDVAVNEFAENDYDNASVTRIVQEAGIAKGSFYQYFDDKEDLYTYVISLITDAKAAMFSLNHPDPEHVGLFNYLRWILRNSVEFELAYPQFSRIGYRMLKGGSSESRLLRQTIDAAEHYYTSLVKLGKAQGDIAADIDEALAASFFRLIMSELGPKIVQEAIEAHGTDWQGKRALFDFPEVREKYEQMFRILEFGLSGQPVAVESAALVDRG